MRGIIRGKEKREFYYEGNRKQKKYKEILQQKD